MGGQAYYIVVYCQTIGSIFFTPLTVLCNQSFEIMCRIHISMIQITELY